MRFVAAINTSLYGRLAGVVAVPMLAVLALLAMLGQQQWHRAQSMQRLGALADFAIKVSDVVHELQKERGMSAVFINSGGQQLAAELPGQRALTDSSAAAARATIARLDLDAMPATLARSARQGIAGLDELAARREAISARRIPAPESNQFFTATIGRLLAITREAVKASVDPEVTAGLLSAYSYSSAKERAGQERAGGAVGFAAGTFTPAQHRAFVVIVADQRAFTEAFESYATEAQRSFARAQLVGAVSEQVDRFRALALETEPGKPLTDVTGAAWYNATTARIELMKKVEDRLNADLIAAASAASVAALRSFWLALAFAALGLLLAGAITVLLSRGLVRPLTALIAAIRRLADGDLDTAIPALERKDEVGRLAASMAVFRSSMAEARQLRAEQEERAARAAADKAREMSALADRFEASVGGVVKTVATAATDLSSAAKSLEQSSEQTASRARQVASSSEEASTNVQTVAAASEELSASIAEIARLVSDSTEISAAGVAEAKDTDAKVQGLADAAQKIGEVVKLISDIAGQTNLLALNATIEAARAGEAGKGFAVVAAEVKNLANQTARATDDIGQQIAAIQGATSQSVGAIRSIGRTIGRMSEIATAVAAAVEQQRSATQEIARNVQQASRGTSEVSSTIVAVSEAAADAGRSAGAVMHASGDLAHQGDTLRQQVADFLATVRAA